MEENVKGQNSNKNQEDLNQEKRKVYPENDMTSANSDHQNISQNRGGTTDMGSGNQLRGAAGSSTRANRGSGMTTKRSVTGSDYDGQISEG